MPTTEAIRRLDVPELRRRRATVGDAAMVRASFRLMCFKLIQRNLKCYAPDDTALFLERGGFTLERAREALEAVLDLGMPEAAQRGQRDVSPWEALEIVSAYGLHASSCAETVDPAALDWSCALCIAALSPCSASEFTLPPEEARQGLGPRTVEALRAWGTLEQTDIFLAHAAAEPPRFQ